MLPTVWPSAGSRTAAKDYASQGIRINELRSGVIDTELTQSNPEGTQAVADHGIPLRRFGTAVIVPRCQLARR